MTSRCIFIDEGLHHFITQAVRGCYTPDLGHAAATLMCGSSPLPGAVTRSTGIGRVLRDRYFDGPVRLECSAVEKLAKFREVRVLIEEKIKVWVEEQVSAR